MSMDLSQTIAESSATSDMGVCTEYGVRMYFVYKFFL